MTGCTSCGNKGGCDHRKGAMFAAIDDALGRLYPSRRWDDRVDSDPGAASAAECAAELGRRLATKLGTLALVRRGGPDECCDYVYVLCLGRRPSILEVREGAASPADTWHESGGEAVLELHLRVALSTLAPFAAVQQVALAMTAVEGELVIEETPRTGVFDGILLPRLRGLVAVLAEFGIRNLDFGDLTHPPDGFDGTAHSDRYGTPPVIANYLFYPQPCAAITTTVHSLRRS